MNRRNLMFGAAGAATLGGLGVWLGRRPTSRPRVSFNKPAQSGLNILFVLNDQERAWDLYPKGFIETHCPGRHALLEKALYVDGAYTPVQLCSMARGVIYTGQHAPGNGVWENVPLPGADSMKTSVPTLGSLFQDAGYRTGYAGKWHLTKLRERHGANVGAEIRSFGFDECDLESELEGPLQGFERDGETTRNALRFIDRNKQADKPWFLAVNYLNPHDIMYYAANDKMIHSRILKFAGAIMRPPQDPFYQTDLGYNVFGPWGQAATQNGRPAAIEEYAKCMDAVLGTLPYDDHAIARDFQNYYWNCTRDADRQFVDLMEGLKASGELDRTIIVFTSDHGEFLGSHGLRGKGTSGYHEASAVPLIISHPDGPKGANVTSRVSHVDLVPTLLGLAGADLPAMREQTPEITGHDLSGIVGSAGGPSKRDDEGTLLYWTSLAFVDHTTYPKFNAALERGGIMGKVNALQALMGSKWENRSLMRGIHKGKWKFCRYFSSTEHNVPHDWDSLVAKNDFELYDTEADPHELVNLATDPAFKEKVLEMSTATNALIAREIGADNGEYLPRYARA